MPTVNAPQPTPIANASMPIVEFVLADLEMCVGDRAVTELASRDLRERAEAGKIKYGVYLQAHNGRDALVDAYQEAQDLVMYLRQRIAENRIADPAEYDDDLALDYSAAVRLMLRLAVRVRRAELERAASEPRVERSSRELADMLGAPVDEQCARCGTVGPVSEACRECQASSSAVPNDPAPCGLAASEPAPPPPKPCAQRHPDGDRWCYLPDGHEGPHDAPAPRALPASDHGPHGARRTAP